MNIREVNWPILGVLVGIILFWVSACLILSKSGIFQEISSWLDLISTGRALF